jgi:hypothetical protein
MSVLKLLFITLICATIDIVLGIVFLKLLNMVTYKWIVGYLTVTIIVALIGWFLYELKFNGGGYGNQD